MAILVNLLSMPPSTHPSGGCASSSRGSRGGKVVFLYATTDRASAPELLSRVFELFAMVTDRSPPHPRGARDGLTLVVACGAARWQPSPGRAAGPAWDEFVVRLPAGRRSRLAPTQAEGRSRQYVPSDSPARRRRVLVSTIVTGERIARSEALRAMTCVSPTTREALLAARAHRPM